MKHDNRKKRHRPIVAFFFFTLFFLPSHILMAQNQPENCDELSEEQVVARVIKSNPDLAAIRSRYEALAAVPTQLATLPDPILFLGAVNLPTDTFDLDQENMTQMQIGISQKFPFPGKLSLKEETAALEAEAALEMVGDARLNLVKNSRKIWWDIFYLQKGLAIVRSNQSLLRATVAAARTKYEVGKGLQQDVLLAQLELTRLMDREIIVTNGLEKKKASLAALIDRPAGGDCFVISSPNKGLDLPEILSLTKLQAIALTSHPGLLALKKKADASRKKIDLARKDYYPDFTLGAAYGYRQDMPDGRDRSDFASIKLNMNLPIWTGSKQDKAVAQRKSELLTAEHNVRALTNQIQAEITSEFSEYSNTSQQCILYRTSLIPQAEQTAAAMLKGYQVNKVDFLNVVRAQLALYNYKITYWNHLSSAFKALAGLEAATGAGTSVYKENE